MALNLNYTPNKLVDITTLTEDQWLDWRRKGIGGSDVAVALNSSPYRTPKAGDGSMPFPTFPKRGGEGRGVGLPRE